MEIWFWFGFSIGMNLIFDLVFLAFLFGRGRLFNCWCDDLFAGKSIQWSNYVISLSQFLNHPKEKRSSWALDSRKSLNTLPFWAVGFFLKLYFDYYLRIFLIRSFWKFEFPLGPPFKINWLYSLQIECATQIVCRLEQLQRRLHSICSKWFPRTFFYFPNILIELFLIATMGWWIKLQGNWGRCWSKLFFFKK